MLGRIRAKINDIGEIQNAGPQNTFNQQRNSDFTIRLLQNKQTSKRHSLRYTLQFSACQNSSAYVLILPNQKQIDVYFLPPCS